MAANIQNFYNDAFTLLYTSGTTGIDFHEYFLGSLNMIARMAQTPMQKG